MFEVFSQRLDTELGQINPAWFEELTAKASHGHGGAVIADRAEVLCPLSSYAQNDIGKTPGGVFGSQMFSTPKLFQHRGLCSPDLTQNEESHTPNQGLNDTPKSSLAQSAKRISESLGAQINPDLSWSSSFNTPSAITPTVILSNKEDQSSPTRPSHDKNVIFVRELFPSVTNSCTGAKPLTENTATCPDDEICQDDGGKLCGSPDNINNVWEQKVPHAISDGDVRTTVENVLDGAEDVLSIFFSNSGPALRRVKNKERIKRAQSESAKENPQALPAERTKELNETPKRATYKKQGFAASETNNSVKLTEFGCIQWTPISLSEISDTSDQSCPTQSAPLNKCVVNQSDRPDDVTFDPARSQKTSQLSVSMAEKLNSPGCLVSPSSILIRTPRRFVYHVTSSHAAKPEVNHGSLLPERGFKTFADGIRNGSSSQEVKSLFKDIEPEPFLTSSTHDLKGKQCIEISEQLNPTCKKTADIRSEEKGSGTQSHQNLTHQLLTASQKADVSELCSLLEEADSQYEFTQFKAAKQCSDPHHKGSQPFEKEWDADILSGIDFDDSFDEQLMRKHHVMTGILNKPTTSLCGEQDQEESKHSVDMSGSHDRTGKMREEDALRVMTGCRITPSPPSAHLYSVPECTRAESIQTTTKGSSDTDLGKSFHVGFKTGRGEILRVSERCLSTARTLFADLDESSESFAEAYKKMPDIAAREQEQSCPSSGRILSLPSIFRAELGHNTEKTPQASSVVIHANLKHCGTGGNSMGSGTKSELELTKGLKQKFGNGFMTASGKGVTVSTKALQEAKTIFKDRDLDSPATAQTELEKSGVKCDYSNDKGNCTEDGTGVAAPEISQTAQSHRGFNEHPRAEFTTASFEICYFRSSCGFSTASGRSVSVSTEAIQKSRTLFADLDDTSFCENVKEMKKCENLKMETSATNKGGGFSTASGRKVFISETALQKAKNMFNECDDKTFESEKILVDSMKNSAPDPGQKMCFGFSTASGKGVTISEKALQEAKSMFMGCDDDDFSDIGEPITWGTSGEKKHSDRHRGHQERACIGGPDGKSSSIMERVPVGASIVPGISNSLQDEHFESDKPGINKFGFNTASGKRVCVSRQAQGEALERFRDCSDLLEQPQKSKDSVPLLPSLTDKGFAPPTTQKDLSSLKSDPVAAGVGTIVDTQQEFSQLEAEACAKALLEDEGFREQATSVSRVIRESPHNHAPAKLNNRTRKRMLDSSIIEENLNHLPLKRRLLDDFAQRTDDVRCSDCIPVRSSPNGTLKDRRVFKYTVPLRPNVTHPDRTAVDHKPNKPESFAVLNSKPCSSKAAFVPPFRKNGKTDVQKNCVSQKATKHPSMFVPPLQKKDERSLHSSPDSHPMKRLEFQSQAEILQSVQLARDVQDMRIRKKKHQSVQPVPGSLFLAKSSGLPRVSVREAVGLTRPARYTSRELYECGVPYQVIQVSSENAESFRFQFEHFFGRNVCVDAGGVRVGDGGWLIPDNALTVGKEEFFRALCDTPGVDPRLISEAWVYNHYRWIVWKLASMERSFPAMMGGRCLTLERVLLQLKYRYDVEVDHCQRSALKKIMERDDTPAKTLVLCVCGIATLSNGAENPSYAENGPSPGRVGSRGLSAIVWVTDGWYTIKALLDPPLSAMLRKGRLAVGGKIVTHGAELVGSQDACSPLEAPESLMLKIWANSTRRARWDVRLGFQRDPRPFPLSLSSLYSDGGSVGCVDIVVLRSYPTQWMEKKSSGVFVFRNDRAEEREARKHSETRQKDMELLFSRIQAQFESEERGKSKCRGRMRTLSVLEIEAMQDGEELYDAVEADPLYLEAHLSEKQLEILSSYRRVLAERRHTDLQEQFRKAVQENEGCCPDRDVTPVWKLSVRDSSDTHCSSVYTLNIWRPSPDLRALLREGSRYKVCHLSTSEGKKQAGKATTQFTITKKTQFERMQVCPEWLHHRFQARQSANFKDLQNPAFHSPCEEVDIVGYVVSILDRHGTSPVLYLVDENHNFVSVRSKSSLTQLALDDLVKPLALLAISNLQLKQPRAPIPCLYAGDLALFSTSPKEPHLQEATGRLKTFAQGREYFFTLAEEKLSSLVPLGGSNTAHFPRTPGMPVRLKPSSSFNVTPQAETELSQCLPVNKRPHPSLNTPENKDPKTLKRKRSLDYLLRVPSPPALSPLGTVISPCVSKTFNPPRRCKTPRVGHTAPAGCTAPPPVEDDWVNDEEMAMINTQALLDRVGETGGAVKPS
ncbi:breast cancer type 2 susceptibility protein [Chanos chanos]|uniref:Breast cancer type 2 susceptibility protein n=1 Tax=Chanos chanos TaxID=29144 RepID=A0A6J2VPL2_CHACN|nr:breast cancer type 2 susceptibility protein [Chanos chanos]